MIENDFSNKIEKIMKNAKRVHFIGIGGISMCSLAMITAEHNIEVTGSDRTPSEITAKMEKLGIKISYEHKAENVEGASLVVYTAAIHPDNPEYIAAKNLGIPMFIRAEYLGWLMLKYNRRIGIAGSHGKSTVTAMISSICMENGNPTVLCGAEASFLDGTFRIGDDGKFIFEACEYCNSFLSFFPTLSVITNIEYDHPDFFKDMDMLKDSFLKFSNIGEKALISADDLESEYVKLKCQNDVVTFGINNKADYLAKNIVLSGLTSSFDLYYKDDCLGRINLNVPGMLNVYNALCAAAASMVEGKTFEDCSKGLSCFPGIKRRFELLGKTSNGAVVYDDYAHHPTELKATIRAAKEALTGSGKRLVCLFQPHTYSRTAALFDEFVDAFSHADVKLFSDIYAAREENIYGVSSKQLAEATNGVYVGNITESAQYVMTHFGENDVVMILGAGDIIKVGPMIVTN